MKRWSWLLVGVVALALSACGPGASGSATGTWNGSLVDGGTTLYFRLGITDTNGALTGTLNSCTGLGTGCQQTGTLTGSRTNANVQIATTNTANGGVLNWAGTLNGNTISGTVSAAGGAAVNFSMSR
jgi:hypothetical protein